MLPPFNWEMQTPLLPGTALPREGRQGGEGREVIATKKLWFWGFFSL